MRYKNAYFEKQLLKLGGTRCVIPAIEEDLQDIMVLGFEQKDFNVIMGDGETRECHKNASQLWFNDENNRIQLCTGYALSRDGIWRPHSWCRDIIARDFNQQPRIIETTTRRTIYFGFVMKKGRAVEFCRANGL